MANNMNKDDSKKKKSVNNSSNQKENRPKKVKLDPNDSISMSKQLQIKKTSQSNKRAQKQSVRNDAERVCPNGKRMPSLAELEKMYEDSDTDEAMDNTPNTNGEQLSTPQIILPNVVIPDHIISPSTRQKISEQVKELLQISDCRDDDVSRPLPNKRLKFDTCDNVSPVTSIPNNKQIANFQAGSLISLHEKKKKDDPNDGQFTPKASTSKNINITMDNHKLFIKSLQRNSTNKTENQQPKNKDQNFAVPICPETPKTDTEITQPNNEKQSLPIPISADSLKTDTSFPSMNETNVPANNLIEDDDVIIEEPNIVKIVIDSEPQNINSSKNISANAIAEARVNHEEDECMIIDSHPVVPITTKPKSQENDIIDLDYAFIKDYTETLKDNNNINHMDDAVIDVDALIAQNQSILSKIQNSTVINLDNSNLVVDVDVSKKKKEDTQYPPVCIPVMVNETDVIPLAPISLPQEPPIIFANEGARIILDDEIASTSTNIVNINVMHSMNNVCPICSLDEIQYLEPGPSSSIYSTVCRYKPRNKTAPSMSQMQPQQTTTPSQIPTVVPPTTLSTKQPQQTTSRAQIATVVPPTTLSTKQPQQTTTLAQIPTVVPPTTLSSTLDSECILVKSFAKLGDCPICLDEMLVDREIGSTTCGHLFCMSCVRQAVKTNGRCPTCRKLLHKTHGYHQIYANN